MIFFHYSHFCCCCLAYSLAYFALMLLRDRVDYDTDLPHRRHSVTSNELALALARASAVPRSFCYCSQEDIAPLTAPAVRSLHWNTDKSLGSSPQGCAFLPGDAATFCEKGTVSRVSHSPSLTMEGGQCLYWCRGSTPRVTATLSVRGGRPAGLLRPVKYSYYFIADTTIAAEPSKCQSSLLELLQREVLAWVLQRITCGPQPLVSSISASTRGVTLAEVEQAFPALLSLPRADRVAIVRLAVAEGHVNTGAVLWFEDTAIPTRAATAAVRYVPPPLAPQQARQVRAFERAVGCALHLSGLRLQEAARSVNIVLERLRGGTLVPASTVARSLLLTLHALCPLVAQASVAAGVRGVVLSNLEPLLVGSAGRGLDALMDVLARCGPIKGRRQQQRERQRQGAVKELLALVETAALKTRDAGVVVADNSSRGGVRRPHTATASLPSPQPHEASTFFSVLPTATHTNEALVLAVSIRTLRSACTSGEDLTTMSKLAPSELAANVCVLLKALDVRLSETPCSFSHRTITTEDDGLSVFVVTEAATRTIKGEDALEMMMAVRDHSRRKRKRHE